MKFRSFIWISATAMVILGLVQYYFITETFKTKQEQFDSKYSSLGKLGVYEYDNLIIDRAEDSIMLLLDDLAYFSMHDVHFSDTLLRDSIYTEIHAAFNEHLNSLYLRDLFLEEYLKNSGEDYHFNSWYLLREITFLNFEQEVPVYSSTGTSLPGDYLLNSYTVERNYFRIQYDFYIAFPNRSEQISREMFLTKGLSILTLLIVFGVFFMTLRNLFIQKRLSDMKTDFINNMTHELKTPLSTISVATSSLSLANESLPPDRVKEISAIIKKQNKHLSRLIDRILDISIWEKDQVRIATEDVQVEKFFNEILEEFKSTHPAVHLDFELVQESENQNYSLDPVHMTTVINNLLSNAVKYGGEEPELNFRVQLSNRLVIEIKDNGPGIPTDEQKHIFEKFYRGKKAKTDAVRGLGLGLYYVKQIVGAHGGSIELKESSPGGSVFLIQIPV